MHGKHLYEYAVIRIVPRVEREEFLNCGIILLCKESGYLECIFHMDKARLLLCDVKLDLQIIEEQLTSMQCIARGETCGSPIAKLPAHDRFRWLTATRSTMIQCSKVHPGFSDNLEKTLNHLMHQLVF